MAKILLAEDDTLTRSTLAKFLRASGYDVEVAADVAQALSRLNQQNFDLILSDVVMPNGNGWDLVDHISSIAPKTRVLLMTAYSAFKRTGKETGTVPELILKPLILTELLTKIQKLLGQ